MIKKAKKSVPWTYDINDLNDEEIAANFYEKGLQKINQVESKIKIQIKKKLKKNQR